MEKRRAITLGGLFATTAVAAVVAIFTNFGILGATPDQGPVGQLDVGTLAPSAATKAPAKPDVTIVYQDVPAPNTSVHGGAATASPGATASPSAPASPTTPTPAAARSDDDHASSEDQADHADDEHAEPADHHNDADHDGEHDNQHPEGDHDDD
jgi:hypothetical protein